MTHGKIVAHRTFFNSPPHVSGLQKKSKTTYYKVDALLCHHTHTHNLTFLDSGYVCVCVFVVLILENSSALRAGS